MDFLRQILHNDKELIENFSHFSEDMQTADDECELEEQILADTAVELDSNELDSNDQGDQPSFMDMVDAIPETKDGSCIACLTSVASVVFMDCKHNAVCLPCWEMIQKIHIENCHKWLGDNERKLQRELNNFKCPKCGAPARDTLVIHTNAF